MKLYRIAKSKFIKDLTGEGAKINGGRWNHPGFRVLYCSQSLSLCLLEMLVHMNIRQMPTSFSSFEAELPDQYVIKLAAMDKLKAGWRSNPPKEFTKDIGTSWLISQESLAVLVPSAVLPSEYNLLVNPEHPEFISLQLNDVSVLDVDHRIW